MRSNNNKHLSQMNTLKLNQNISTLSFEVASNHPIYVKLSQIHGVGRVSKITKDGAYIRCYSWPRSIFLTNAELNMRTAIRMGVEQPRTTA